MREPGEIHMLETKKQSSDFLQVGRYTISHHGAYLSRVIMRPIVLTATSASAIISSLYMNQANECISD